METKTVFSSKTYSLEKLLTEIDLGNIALPDIQRPFVWKMTKVRDLFDSLYKGLPIGSIILWEIYEGNYRHIGDTENKRAPRFLVIDGQQRLTSLYSVVKNKKVLSRNVKKIKIQIAFNPIEEKFEVTSAAISKSPLWIHDISEIFTSTSTFNFINNYLKKIDGLEVEKEKIPERIERVASILKYTLPVIELSTELDPEEVSEIFVRINSKGESLTQSDFILTLMSVYWPEGREQLENFSKSSYKPPSEKKATAYNLIGIRPQPENLVRTIVAYAFNRGRLRYAFLTLKGRDFANKVMSEELRQKSFDTFKQAQMKALDLSNWHDFIKIVHSGGFVSANKLISSELSFYISYAFYLLGKYYYKVDYKQLEKLIRKWFAFLQLTSRYTGGSAESFIEQDLKTLKSIGSLEDFINSRIQTKLTNDFWNITLPDLLYSSSSKNSAYLVYQAALVYFDVPVLFSEIKLRDFLNPLITKKKNTIDEHHIFPKEYLKSLRYDRKMYNQVANFVYLEYKDNIKIGKKPPKDYWLKMMNEIYGTDKAEIYDLYDLPKEFYLMNYEDFLQERRKLMALKIKSYFQKL